jgi:hypothetical protein
VVIVASLLSLAGCAQTWTHASGTGRGGKEFAADVDRCNLAAFGIADVIQIRNYLVGQNLPGADNSEYASLGWERADECLEKSGWALRTM